MGEATYYFKAEFINEKQAKSAFKKIKKYLTMNNKAYNFWQKHRREPTCLKQLQKKFKELKEVMNAADGNNSLAGKLIDTSDMHELRQEGALIFFSATVWHFDEWEHLVEFAKKLNGCIKSDYLSDEYAEPNYYDLM